MKNQAFEHKSLYATLIFMDKNSKKKGWEGAPKGRVFQSKKYDDRNRRFREERRSVGDKPKMEALSSETPDTFEGVFKLGKNGFGFVTHKESGAVVLIEPQHNLHAFIYDKVKVEVLNRAQGTGKVIEIAKRSKVAYAGTLTKYDGYYSGKPTDPKEPEIRIDETEAKVDATLIGKKVLVRLTRFEGDIAYGAIQTVLGDAGTNDAEMEALALEKGFDREFPEEVITEADKLHGSGIPESEVSKRRDMRGITTFTIDPIDAKDFDDALSFQTLSDGNYEIGVHIADVSFYVTPGSALDDEARKRTTSVYLVDRVVPMLPEVLSNELCSIRQDEDKLAFSTVFKINKETGEVMETWYGRTIIRSDKRFTYEEAQEIINNGDGLYYHELIELNRLAKIYTQQRFAAGALSMDQAEVRFILDESGKPIRVMIKNRIDTNKLIEEFMLLANKYVAMKIGAKDSAGAAVYRVHDKPSEERMMDLQNFLRSMGYQTTLENGIIPPRQLQKIIDEAGTDDARDTIQTSIVRSMAKAIYSTTNIGHFGLAFTYYTHFTSPIRRYPDVMVHRLLQMTLDGKKVSPEEFQDLEYMSRFSSDRERDAQEAEWASIKYKQVEYMRDRIGKQFIGSVTGVSKNGLFVAEVESKSEGMIRLSDLGKDFYAYDEKSQAIVGQKSGEMFRVGDKLPIIVKDANLDKRMIDYVRVVTQKTEE
jgi:ribonuclease R